MAAHFFRARRAFATGLSFSLIATASISTLPSGTAFAETIEPEVVEQLAAAGQSLAMISTLPDMAETVPGLATNPGLLLGIHEAFAQLAALTPASVPTTEDLVTTLESFAAGGYAFGNVAVEVNGTVTSIEFDLSASRTEDSGLAIVTDDAQLTGGSVPVAITLPSTPIRFEYDSSIGDPADAFALTTLPSLDFTVQLDESISESVLVGFAEATATGTFALDVSVGVDVVDPDGTNRLTATELTTADIASLVALDLGPSGGPDVAVDLGLSADVFGNVFTGSLTIDDESIFADPEPVIDLSADGPNPIDLFTNFSSEASITALAQLVSGFGAAMIGGDVDLPFLSDGLLIPGDLAETGDYDRIFEAIEPLLDYVEPRAAGQIVCGTAATSPDGGATEGAPFGQTLFLTADDVAQCRAYTTTDGTNVQWEVLSGNATITDLGTSDDTVGDAPTKNVKIDMTAPGQLQVKVTYTPAGGSPTVILERPDTVQELLLELLDSGLIPEDSPGVPAYDYEPALQAISFDVGTSVPGITRNVNINAGNEIVAQTGISGLSAVDGGASASMEISDIDAGVTLGLILADDVATINPADNAVPGSEPGPSDRFFLRGTESMLSVQDVAFTGSADLEGRLGFLEILASLEASLTAPDDEPAISIGLGSAQGVTVGAGNDPTATLVNDLLRGGPGGFTFDANLVFDGNLAVSSSVPGLSATGEVTIDWDLDDPAPTVDFDGNFENNLFPFDTAQSFTYTGDGSDESLFTSTTGGLLAQAGLVGSQLVDPNTNATCTIVSVVNDTSLRCENPTDGGTDLNPIDFTDGTEYQVTGNTLAYLTEILAALEGLADYLEVVVGDTALETPIPVIGITPADLIGQISKLRTMIDEFRGVQDGQILCDVTAPAGQTDARAIASADGSATLSCKAVAAANAPSAIRWRAIVNGTPGAWVDGPDTVGSAPSAAVTLNLTGADVVDDDFIVLGEEYSVEVEWTDDGETRTSALPPRTPQSLTDLSESVSEILGLPDGVLEFQLLGAPAAPVLRINLGYGICSSTPPVEGGLDCTGAAVGDTPTANLNVDLGGTLPDMVGLETTGTLQVRYAAIGQFDVGVPLTGGVPVLYGTSGIDVVVEVEGTDLGIAASVGPANATLGNGAGELTGNADNDNDDAADDNKLLDDAVDFDVDAEAVPRVPNGAFVRNTTDGQSCIGANAFDGDPTAVPDSLECTLTGGAIWDNNDAYVIGDQSTFKAGLSFSISPTGMGGTVLGDGDSIAFDSPDLGLDVTDFAQVGTADCGPAATGFSTGNVIFGADDGDGTLSGLACARLSMELGLGDAGIYLGELGLDFDGTSLVVYVPSDLATRLESALLDPAFLLRALPPILAEIEGGLRDAANSGVPSAVADPLQVGADGINALKVGVEDVIDTFGDALGPLTGASPIDGIAATLQSELQTLLDNDVVDVTVTIVTECKDPGDGNTDCTGRGLLDLVDIRAELTFSGEFVAGTGVNLGLEGLPISFEAGLEGYAGWEAELGIGVNRDEGPYLALNTDPADPELSFQAGVRLNDQGAADCDASLAPGIDPSEYTADRCLKGRLAFLFIEALDRTSPRSEIAAEIGLNITSSDAAVSLSDLLGGDIGVEPVISGGINLDLHIRTGIETPLTTSADLPTIVGTLHLQWGLDSNGNETPLTIEFENLHLDVGTFLDEFLGPITKEIRKITGPLQPIIDVLMAPIPVISDLSELVGAGPVTMISLLEVATGADLSLVRAVAAFITFVNNLPDDAGAIPLGGLLQGLNGNAGREPGAFSVNTAAAESTVSPENAGALIGNVTSGGSGFAQDLADGTALPGNEPADDGRPTTFGVPGLSFPFLDDASQIFGLLVGRDAVLIRWDAGTLEAEAGFSYDFGPIMVGPVPITITIGGDIGVRGRFAIGYDTSGIRKLLDGGSGFALFDGIFIDDLDSKGNDVPEIEFFGRVFAGAAVDLVIISAGVRGGIELTFSLDLDDRPDPDGKLRIEEIVEKLANPICLFVVSGKIEAFLEAFVEIDLFFYSEEFSFELVRITLLEWSSACEPPTPVLAEASGDVLYINAGTRRDRRNIQEDVKDESIEVRQIGPSKVRVSGFGWEEVHDGVGLIVADGGDGSDELKFLSGTVEGTDDTQQPWSIPVVASGGRGDDIVVVDGDVDTTGNVVGSSDDHLFGDADIVAGSWAGKNYSAIPSEGGTSGKDQINAGTGDDLIEAGDGDDRADGQFGDDTVLGGGADDTVSGGPGNDVVDGQAGNDTVQGGPIEQPKPGENANDDDVLVGGSERDVLSGDFGNDVGFGDAIGADAVTVAADGRQTRSAPDRTKFLDWCDDPAGGGDGDDILTGTDGDDVLVGGGGLDSIDGGNGNDWGCGGPGNDTVLGQAGNDVLRGDGDDDSIDGADGNDIVNGGGGNDTAVGGAGNDDMFGDAGSDNLTGNGGDDVMVGDTGSIDQPHAWGVATGDAIDAAKVQALDGNLTVDAGGSGARRTGCDVRSGDSDCLFGSDGSDALFGGGDGDILFGEAGADLVEGNEGDDDIRGSTGNDLLLGSAGADLIAGDAGADQAYGDRSIGQWLSNTPATGGDDVVNGGPDADWIEGDGGADDIQGAAAADHIEGNNGADRIRGDAGDDDIIGGSDTDAADGDGGDTGDTWLLGGLGDDVIAGDNAAIAAGGPVLGRSVDLNNPGTGAGDLIEGDAGSDAMFGQAGDDDIWGDLGVTAPNEGTGGADYAEGNRGIDEIAGEVGNDDLIGGSSAADGVIDADRSGNGELDAGDEIDGGPAADVIAGDNALVNRLVPSTPANAIAELFDVTLAGVPGAVGVSGADTIDGGSENDIVFGQGVGDTVHGDGGDDYVEGNDGDDSISGDAGNDDLVGGGSATDGIIDPDRTGNGLADVGETLIDGGVDEDWIAGDNALIDRNVDSAATAPIVLFDVETVTTGAEPGTGGGEVLIMGGTGPDWIFGQTGGDTIQGNEDADYVEGNNGPDVISGGEGDDDLVGGGSADDGVIDADRTGNGLLDVADPVIDGGAGDDWITGDNALVSRNRPATGRAAIELFDVDLVATTPGAGTSGGEPAITGGTGTDRIFGQGGDDTIDAGDAPDYVEGNHADDTILGGGGDDELIGGGSARDGVIDGNRQGNELEDGRDTIDGQAGDDRITGDNAIIVGIVPADPGRAPIELFDVQTSGGEAVSALTSGGDTLYGNVGQDRIFGGGNGAQPASQTDPDDDRNNDFVGSTAGTDDFDRYPVAAGVDEDQAGWLGDTIVGGLGDDTIEGNHGNDLIFGNGTGDLGQDEDDVNGGGSADDGRIFAEARAGLGANLLDGADTIHGDSTDNQQGDDDAIVGDNGWVQRLATKQTGPIGPDGAPVDQWDRNTQMSTTKTVDGTFGNDFVSGNGGHDELFGQMGDDYVEGGWGSDAMVGDLGKVTTDLFTDALGNEWCGAARTISPNEPFVQDPVCQLGTLFRLVQLYAFDDTIMTGAGAVAAGDDVMLGLDGDDWIHGGAGADMINGDGDAGPETVFPDAPAQVVDPNANSADTDRIFGGDSNGRGNVDPNTGGNGDAIWGGRGHDHTYGGRGDDMLDVRPNVAQPQFFPLEWSAWAEADVESYHGIDFMYGGYDQDAMQANVADNGPIEGDRLFDWVGAYNIYYLCPATYGAYVNIRDQSPAIIAYFETQAATDGALRPKTAGTSGFNELAMVYKPDVKNNANPIYPGTPGHFFCGPTP